MLKELSIQSKKTNFVFVSKNNVIMSFWRVILSLFLPPLAVFDKGCGSILIVLLLTICGWVPGVIAALVILNNPKYNR